MNALTSEEINSIVDVVSTNDCFKHPDEYAALVFKNNLRTNITNQLKCVRYNAKMAGSIVRVIADRISKDIQGSIGLPAGMIASQMTEGVMQDTLNTFHSTGDSSKNVSSGVDRVNEIMNISKEPKNVSWEMTPLVFTPGSYDYLIDLKIGDFLLRVSNLMFLPKDLEQEFEKLYAFKNTGFVKYTVIYLDVKSIVKKKVYSWEVSSRIHEHFLGYGDCLALFSFSRYAVVVFHNNDIVTKDKARANCTKASNNLREINDEIMKIRLSDKCVAGISSVFEHDGVIDGNGGTLTEMWKTSGFNHLLTMTNNIYDVYVSLGIEAARKSIANEVYLCTRSAVKNTALIAAHMTYFGYLVPLSRHGLVLDIYKPLATMAFETTLDIIAKVGAKEEKEDFTSTNACIMIGKKPLLGTNAGLCIVDDNDCVVRDNCLYDKNLRVKRRDFDPVSRKDDIFPYNEAILFDNTQHVETPTDDLLDASFFEPYKPKTKGSKISVLDLSNLAIQDPKMVTRTISKTKKYLATVIKSSHPEFNTYLTKFSTYSYKCLYFMVRCEESLEIIISMLPPCLNTHEEISYKGENYLVITQPVV